jgi:hypothetical protein
MAKKRSCTVHDAGAFRAGQKVSARIFQPIGGRQFIMVDRGMLRVKDARKLARWMLSACDKMDGKR